MRRDNAIRNLAAARRARGFSLIELMISLILGLLVVAAAGGLFMSNKRIYASTETLNRIQENNRVSFEIMSRDLREAGGIPCGAGAVIVNLLNSHTSDWWQSFDNGMRGYESDDAVTGAANRVDGTDAIDVHLANENEAAVAQQMLPDAELTLGSAAGFAANDIVVACNTARAYVFQVSAVNGNALKHETGGTAPGNCVSWLVPDEPTACPTTPTTGHCLLVPTGTVPDVKCVPATSSPALVARIGTVRWFIGTNNNGGRSLYRSRLTNTTLAGDPTVVETVEVAEGVSDMQLQYRVTGSTTFNDADAATNWRAVNAVRITLTIEGNQGALRARELEGTDGEVLARQVTHVVAVRNREGVL